MYCILNNMDTFPQRRFYPWPSITKLFLYTMNLADFCNGASSQRKGGSRISLLFAAGQPRPFSSSQTVEPKAFLLSTLSTSLSLSLSRPSNFANSRQKREGGKFLSGMCVCVECPRAIAEEEEANSLSVCESKRTTTNAATYVYTSALFPLQLSLSLP